jgi:hypothetical protein
MSTGSALNLGDREAARGHEPSFPKVGFADVRIKNMPSTVERFIGFGFFAGFAAADLLISHVAAVRVAGLVCAVCGISWVWQRSVGVGIEGREPSFLLTGAAAQLAGLLMLALGLAILSQAARVACVLGWSADALCR